ncbi:Uncharacterized protein XB17_02068 [Leptospira santarosai]|nr:Uncharacterized protein XB17_02068 [Leptospira santarosai]
MIPCFFNSFDVLCCPYAGKSIAIFFTASSFSGSIRFLGFGLHLLRSWRASRLPSRITLENDRSYFLNSPSRYRPWTRSPKSPLTSRDPLVFDYLLCCCHLFSHRTTYIATAGSDVLSLGSEMLSSLGSVQGV